MNFIYCDHAASTPLKPEVTELINTCYQNNFYANPSSIHKLGFQSKNILENSRSKISQILGANQEEVIFTSGATEANNLVLLGLAQLTDFYQKNEIIISNVEHSSVFKVAEFLRLNNPKIKIKYLEVDSEGFVNLEKLKDLVNSKTLLVSIIHAQNEIGTIQDLRKISQICKKSKAFFHSDTVQSVGKLSINFQEEQLDFMTLSAHKFNGPKGIGALIKKKGLQLKNVLHGGDQEKNLSPGTENLVNIYAMSKALELSIRDQKTENQKNKKIQLEILNFLSEKKVFNKKIFLNGPKNLEKRLSNNLSFSFKNLTGEQAVLRLNLKNIFASTGSACMQSKIEPSRIILNLDFLLEQEKIFRAKNSLRVSFGINNTLEQAKLIKEALYQLVV